jgi:alpha-tubulin suppressor-like RCC1 family protein
MKTLKDFIHAGVLRLIALAAFGMVSADSSADTVNVVWNSPADVPVMASGYGGGGNTVNFTLNFAPAPGTELMVVNNTSLDFTGTFDNLGQGQQVALSYGGTNYDFVANYYGGSGNDLVLIWAHNRAFAWGSTYSGDLGDNNISSGLVPVAMDTTPGASALYGKTVVGISAGFFHSLMLCSDGTVAACGSGQDGQLGYNFPQDQAVPVAVSTANSVSALFGKTVVAIAAGSACSLALCSDGTVASWGDNFSGELGDNSTKQRLAPVAVNRAPGSALYNKTVVAIAEGASHSLALCSDGTVVAWGDNNFGQLGDNKVSGSKSLVPVAVNRDSGTSALYGKTVVAITAALAYSVALCSDGTVASWGYNYYGELGDGAVDNFVPPYGKTVPVSVNRAPGSALYNKTVVGISAGEQFCLALCSDGTAVSWGWNFEGQLGDNSTTDRSLPVAVNTSSLSPGQRFTRIAGGSSPRHSLAVVADPLPPPPHLQAQLGIGTVTLQWPPNYPSVILQANSVLADKKGWVDLADTPVFNGTNYSLTLPSTNAACFFRLRSP